MLDIGRYADSDGFLDDLHDRRLWAYRDWVIGALNRTCPATVLDVALAGDLLPNATKGRNWRPRSPPGKRTNENGAIDEETASVCVDRAVRWDRIRHDGRLRAVPRPKYDPIPTKDFYSLTGSSKHRRAGFYAPGRTA